MYERAPLKTSEQKKLPAYMVLYRQAKREIAHTKIN
jgi:hypothetical protein